MSTRTYYRGPDAVVTDRLFVWRTTPDKAYTVRDLRNVGVGRAETDKLRPYVPRVAGGAAVVSASAWFLVPSSAALVVGAVVISAPAALAIAGHWLRTNRWEIRAGYHAREVVLYATTDERTFNQVARALRRAMEDARSPSSRRIPAAA
jgi:hypothetical protein